MSSSGAYSMIPVPPNTMSSPGPPSVSTATVSSQVHSGSAAVLGDDVQCSAAHTSAALTRPPISALIGNGTDPMWSRKKERRRDRAENAVDREQRQNHETLTVSVGCRRTQVGMLSSTPASEPMTH